MAKFRAPVSMAQIVFTIFVTVTSTNLQTPTNIPTEAPTTIEATTTTTAVAAASAPAATTTTGTATTMTPLPAVITTPGATTTTTTVPAVTTTTGATTTTTTVPAVTTTTGATTTRTRVPATTTTTGTAAMSVNIKEHEDSTVPAPKLPEDDTILNFTMENKHENAGLDQNFSTTTRSAELRASRTIFDSSSQENGDSAALDPTDNSSDTDSEWQTPDNHLAVQDNIHDVRKDVLLQNAVGNNTTFCHNCSEDMLDTDTTTLSSLDVLENYTHFPNVVLAILFCVFGLTFLLNAVVAVALYRTRRLKPVLRVLLFNLALTDALSGLVNVYHMIAAKLNIPFSLECIFRYALVVELVSVTLMLMLILALDRVFSLVAALRYEEIITEKRLWIISALNWLINLLFPVIGLWNVDMTLKYCIYQVMIPRTTYFFYGTGCLTEIMIIVSLNVFIMVKTFGHIRQIGQTVVGQGREERIAAMNRKAVVTSLILTLPFLLLNTPTFILFYVFAIDNQLTEKLTGLIAISVCLGLLVMNSLINPFIYVWRSTEVRNEVKRVISCGKVSNRTSFSQ